MVDFKLAVEKWYYAKFAFYSSQHNLSFLFYFKHNKTIYRCFPLSNKYKYLTLCNYKTYCSCNIFIIIIIIN